MVFGSGRLGPGWYLGWILSRGEMRALIETEGHPHPRGSSRSSREPQAAGVGQGQGRGQRKVGRWLMSPCQLMWRTGWVGGRNRHNTSLGLKELSACPPPPPQNWGYTLQGREPFFPPTSGPQGLEVLQCEQTARGHLSEMGQGNLGQSARALTYQDKENNHHTMGGLHHP
jgi:hypothetical protein